VAKRERAGRNACHFYQFAQCGCIEVLVHNKDVGKTISQANWSKRLQRVGWRAAVKQWTYHDICPSQHSNGVSIGDGVRRSIGGNVAGRTGDIFYNHRLSETLGKALCDYANTNVAAGRKSK
jgi:hypothetical protein